MVSEDSNYPISSEHLGAFVSGYPQRPTARWTDDNNSVVVDFTGARERKSRQS